MASPKKPPETTARGLAVVCVHPAGYSSGDGAWGPCPTRSAGELSWSSSLLSGEVSVSLSCHLFRGWAAGRGNRMARLRTATYAISLWCVTGDPPPGCLVDILALAALPYLGSKRR